VGSHEISRTSVGVCVSCIRNRRWRRFRIRPYPQYNLSESFACSFGLESQFGECGGGRDDSHADWFGLYDGLDSELERHAADVNLWQLYCAADGLMVPDGTLNRAFFLGESDSSGTLTYSVESFNMQTFTPIATLEFPGVVGTPTHFIRWGTDGLAFTTTGSSSEPGQVYVIRGTFVNPASTISNIQSKPTVNVRRTWQTPTVLKRAPNPEQELVR
jgi:hypothetical protein